MLGKELKNKKKNDPFVIQEGAFGAAGKLEKYSYVREWIENSFSGRGPQGEVVGKSFDYKRAKIAGVLIFLAVAGLVARAFWLEMVKGDFYSAQAEGNRIRQERVEARRGIIYDRNMNPLVRNIARFGVSAVPADLPSGEAGKKALLVRLGEIIFPLDATSSANFLEQAESSLAKIKKGSLESFRSVYLIEDIGYEAAMRLNLEENNFSGIAVSESGRREYLRFTAFIPSLRVAWRAVLAAVLMAVFLLALPGAWLENGRGLVAALLAASILYFWLLYLFGGLTKKDLNDLLNRPEKI